MIYHVLFTHISAIYKAPLLFASILGITVFWLYHPLKINGRHCLTGIAHTWAPYQPYSVVWHASSLLYSCTYNGVIKLRWHE